MHKQLKEIEKLLRNKRRLVANLSGDDEEVFIRVVQVFVERSRTKLTNGKRPSAADAVGVTTGINLPFASIIRLYAV